MDLLFLGEIVYKHHTIHKLNVAVCVAYKARRSLEEEETRE